MTVLEAVILGIIQGLTEFLPVSSSAHLVIVQYFFGLEGPILLVFDVTVHAGTLLAIFAYFAKELFPVPKIGTRMIGLILLATVPTGLIGLALRETIDRFFVSLAPVALTLLVNSILLLSTRWIKEEGKKAVPKWLDSLWIGIIQGISVLPGISRVGSTVTGALWLGIKREEAVRFSFFIAIPAILGATVLIVPEALRVLTEDMWLVLLTGFATAFFSGYLAITILFRMVSKGQFHLFAWYTLGLSAISFLFSTLR